MILGLALTLLLGGRPARPCDTSATRVGVGLQKVITVDPTLRGFVYSAPSFDVKTIGMNQLLVIGVAEGEGELTLFYEDGPPKVLRFTVIRSDMSDWIFDVSKYLQCGSKLELVMKGDQIIFSGEYSSVDEWRAMTRFALENRNFTIPPPPVRFVQRALSDANLALFKAGLDARVRALGHAPVLWLPRPATAEEAQKIDQVLAPHRDLLIALLAR